jgi:uncharacterized Zn-binding protein involved in type VI secretion
MPEKPAARAEDATAHGGALLSGSPTVKVNSKDAIRLSDPHFCPVTMPLPHFGGVVMLGEGAALTVLINRKPATAIAGQAKCLIPTANLIVTASDNVYYAVTTSIGGLPVTQDSDGTIHIGKHIKIPPAGKRDIHANGTTTTIDDDDYGAHVLADMSKIGSTDVGAQRLQNLDSSGHDVTIVPNGGTTKNAYSGPLDHAGAKDPTKGSDIKLEYTPEEWPPDPRAETTTTGAEGDVVLFHELGHSDHQTHGNEASTTNDPALAPYDTQEEKNTIEPDENTYRAARGFPPRHTHAHN